MDTPISYSTEHFQPDSAALQTWAIFSKLYQNSSEVAIRDMGILWQKRGFISVNFLYFASAKIHGILEWNNQEYANALLESDFLLPDGIALRLLHFSRMHPEIPTWKIILQFQQYSKRAISNLNGTDFIPEFIESQVRSRTVTDSTQHALNLILYGTTPELIQQAEQSAKERFGIPVRAIDGYSQFPEEWLEGNAPTILLVGRGSPKQELWIESMRSAFEKRWNIAVFWVGGLFDFWAWQESRAPQYIRWIGMEWLWRLFQNPKKNCKKAGVSLLFFVDLLTGKYQQ
jgi:exopolysaccharide biosynthesis WecB/TagA/CpsF family protein